MTRVPAEKLFNNLRFPKNITYYLIFPKMFESSKVQFSRKLKTGLFVEFGGKDCVAMTNEIFEIEIRIFDYNMCAGLMFKLYSKNE